VPRFRKKPVEVDAIQFTGDNLIAVAEFMGVGRFVPGGDVIAMTTIHDDKAFARPGDWIIAEPQPNRFYPCAADIFAATYEEV
jgi:hypothetical protein